MLWLATVLFDACGLLPLLADSTGVRIRVDCCGIVVLMLAVIGGWYVFFGNKGAKGR